MRAGIARTGALKNYDAAGVAAGFEIGKGLRCLVDAIAPGDQLVELQPALDIKRHHASDVDARHARAELAAGEGLYLERQRHRPYRSSMARLCDAHHHGENAAP